MESNDTAQDVRQQLLGIEAQITGFLAQLRQHHEELKALDYDRDPRVLRTHLDMWLDWHLFAAEWLVHVRQARSEARVRFRREWQQAVSGTSGFDMDSRLGYAGSYEERKVIYEMKVDDAQRDLDVLDRIFETLIDFIRTLKTTTEHWDKRRVDSKWEAERRARTPGSDYDSAAPTG